MSDLLIELFSEEIPARMQAKAADDLKRMVTDGLVDAGLTYAAAAAFATPRRLCLALEGLDAQSKPVVEERKGPNTSAPQQALDGFLRSTGLTIEQLEKRADKKGEVWFAVMKKPGRPAAEIIAETLEATIRTFPWPKSMRWGTGALRWVRPLHSIICILTDEAGATVVPLEIDGISAGNTTRGHRFLSKGDIKVSGFEDYEAKLKKAHVILRADERAETIWHDATNQAFASGLEVVEDKGLLAEVSGLVEWPVVLSGKIGEAFLGLPPEVLQTSMKEHQKFFSVRNPRSGRIEGFVTVANTETADHGETILKGNQKVLSARLSDARFFWENDLRVAKAGMGEWLDGLKSVTFHNKLGSQADRIERIAALAREIAPLVGADAAQAEEAARIAKADLRSGMVGEFPELQGAMGRYYALEAGRTAAVADAARDHYSPLGPSDAVPTAPVSVAVALADKIDTLTGFWAIDEKPTGSKDPFALRRAALGVTRLIVSNSVRAPLAEVFAKGYAGNDGADLLAFFHDRLKVFLKDQGIRHDVIDACLAMPGNDDLTLLVKRAEALNATLATEDGANLVAGFKRAANILRKSAEEAAGSVDPALLQEPAEQELWQALQAAEDALAPMLKSRDYIGVLRALAGLRKPVDAFFEGVMVNADDRKVRGNRLALLQVLTDQFNAVGDISLLA